jgi:hypothetical protein
MDFADWCVIRKLWCRLKLAHLSVAFSPSSRNPRRGRTVPEATSLAATSAIRGDADIASTAPNRRS